VRAGPVDTVRILAFNCGSSSIKCAVLEGDPLARTFDLKLELAAKLDMAASIDAALTELRDHWTRLGKLDAVVHRVVHGGSRFTAPTLIDAQVLDQLGELERLAPLHNPPAIRAIRGARGLFANVPHIAVFDTAFHATLPARAREYALPENVRTRFGIRRYGFHGISHGHVAAQVASQLKKESRDLRVISCHLGSGASIAAIEYGRSVETSMGMTPLEGLVMGTRAGDLDPGVLLELSREFTPDALSELLNKRAGLAGLTGTGDMREVERRAGEGDETCRLAIGLYAHRIRKYIGAYAAIMGGVDAIAFTGGVGEHSALVRHRCLQRLGFLGAVLDEERNRGVALSALHAVRDVATPESRVRLLVVRADEEVAMAADAVRLLSSLDRPAASLRVPIAISARHAHLCQATIDQLFGAGYQLRPKDPLSQTGQYSAKETVRLIGPRGSIDHVRLMGPPRAHDQVEISRSDEFMLGIDAPVRISGDIDNTPGVTLEGPLDQLTLTSGVICARRHIHMSPHDAGRLGVVDCETVSVRIDSQGRDLTFNVVSVRVAPQFTLELHLDTDEANAAEVKSGDTALLIGPFHDQPRYAPAK
jgi:acetate kinase